MYLTYLYFEPSLLWRDSMFNEFDIDGGETQESYMGTQQVVPLFEKEVKFDIPQPWGRLISLIDNIEHIEFVGDMEYTFGRSKKSIVRLSDARISTNHCKIFRDTASFSNGNSEDGNSGGGANMVEEEEGRGLVYIEDVGSANGTFVNNTKLIKCRRRQLNNGDEILLSIQSHQENDFAAFVFKSTSGNINGMLPPIMEGDVGSNEVEADDDPQGTAAAAGHEIITEEMFSALFDVRHTLGTGAYGEVKYCVRRSTGEAVAVKIVTFKALFFKHNRVREVIKEAEILRALSHRNITALKDIYQTKSNIYLVMELVEGGELLDRIISKSYYPEEEARLLATNMLNAVKYLHDHDIVHRDLKPENILLIRKNSDTDIKLTDFGLATIVGNEGLKTFCGTPQYFAPEVLQRRNTIAGQGRYGKAADMWSIGVIVYIVLCGRPPFSEQFLFEQIEHADYQFEGDIWARVSLAAKEFVCRLMNADPAMRLTVDEALADPWISPPPPQLLLPAPSPIKMKEIIEPPCCEQVVGDATKVEVNSRKRKRHMSLTIEDRSNLNAFFSTSPIPPAAAPQLLLHDDIQQENMPPVPSSVRVEMSVRITRSATKKNGLKVKEVMEEIPTPSDVNINKRNKSTVKKKTASSSIMNNRATKSEVKLNKGKKQLTLRGFIPIV